MILTNNSAMTLTLDLDTWLRSMHTFYPMARLGQQERKYAPDEILDGKMDELTNYYSLLSEWGPNYYLC